MKNQLGQQFGDDRFIEFPGQNVHTHNDLPVAVKVLKTLLKDRDEAK